MTTFHLNILTDITVLYVEPDKEIQKATETILAPRVKKLHLADSAKSALSILDEFHPDLLITAIRLPEIDGLAMIRTVKERYPHIPVIITSFFDDPAYLQEAINLGVEGYILKPINYDKLCDTIFKSVLLIKRQYEMESHLQFMRHILDASPSFMLTLRDGEVEFINKTFLHFMGHDSLEAFLASDDSLINHIEKIEEDSDELFDANMWLQYIINNPGRQHIAYLKGQEGDVPVPYIIQYSKFPELERYLFTFSDITQLEERKDKFEQIARDAKKEIAFKQRLLEMQSRQAQMGEMIGAIAHQWKQPLNALGLIMQDIEDAYSFGEIDESYITEVVGNGMRNIRYMSQTIDDFRDFFKPNKSKKHFNVKKAILDVLDLLGKQYQNNGISVTIDEVNSFTLYGHINEFKQVIINLLNNARDAFIDNKITLRHVTITIDAGDNEGTVKVKDNAGGVAASIMDRMFEPYVTTKSEEKGTGIGLYMSKIIVENSLGGSIDVANYTKAKEKGAEFTLAFPLTQNT